jgi:RNA polymerase-binding transcription factor DksA
MTPEDLKKLDEDLAEEEKLLESELKKIAYENPLVRGDFDVKIEDMGSSQEDAAQEAVDLDRNQALVDELESKLKEIRRTRKKISNGEYGKCENCKSDINPARLQAFPIAALCISCAQKVEK